MNINTSQVALDRRVSIVEGVSKGAHLIRTVSDLRRFSRVVLIGEPGMGKSAVLRQEAQDADSKKINVRSLVNSPAETKFFKRAYLDALDEYRSDGSAADKANFLALSLLTKCPNGWMLSCRSQDWRKDADLNSINEQYEQADSIVVARLLPLEKEEAVSLLEATGMADPDQFYDVGLKKGARAFLQNPLSLSLLQNVVSANGDWPESRYEVFEAATSQLCHENNEERRFQHTKSASEILSVAEELCALLIVTGSRAFWSSNAVPSGANDATEFLKINDTGIERALITQTLDTPLFSGEGEEFEPIHRSVAEFLAARFLAKKAAGTPKTPRVPLSRLLALICATDHKSPTELRGVYAWLAAHLERLGKQDLAEILCVNDPLTVVAYGDAGAFSAKTREQLLLSLDRDDPFFRSHSEGDTALNTLAGEDLAPNLTAILNGNAGPGHSLVTVYDILTTGKPVVSLRPLLRRIALDPKRSEWERWRAFDAWMNGEPHPQTAMRSLFDDLATESPSNGRENLRACIAAGFDENHLTLSDVFSIFSDYEISEEDNTIGRLSRLVRRLEAKPILEFFDVPSGDWRPKTDQRRKSYGISHDLDRILSAAIRSQEALNAETLWRWLRNAGHDRWSSSPRQTRKAVAKWLEEATENETMLFKEALRSVTPDDGPWMPYFNFVETTGRAPSEMCVEGLISPWIKPKGKQNFRSSLRATVRDFCLKLSGRTSGAPEAAKPIGDADKRLLATVADVCRRLKDPAPVFWRAYDVIRETLGEGEILSSLVTCEIPEYMGMQAANKVERELKAESDRTKRIEGWKNGHSLLRSGAGNLDHAAMVYFGFVNNLEREWSRENLQNHFNAEISASIIAGFKRRAEIGLCVPMSELGRLRAKNGRDRMETAIVAAVSIYLKERNFEALDKLPLEAAFSVLLNWGFCDDEEHCSQLKVWAHSKLDGDSERASDLLVSFWLDELDARVALKQDDDTLDIGLVHDFSDGEPKSKTAFLALSKLFDKRFDFPPKVLRSLVRTTVHQWPADEILKICKSVISDEAVSKENRQVWMVVAFAIAPHGLSKQLQSLFAKDRKALAELSDVNETVTKSFPFDGTHDKLAYHVARVEILGPEFPPTGDMFGPRDTVQHSINSLGEILDQEANRALIRLCNLPLLKDWESNLRHAISNNLKMTRDDTFNHPTMKQLKETLAGGPPINAADLRAVMVEVLRGYQEEIVRGDLPAWNGYWNTDQYGKAVDPKIENVCRDQVLTIIRPKLERFAIDLALSEAQRAGGRRADILLATGAGRNLPIEAKRHYNTELWTAVSDQLQDYADDPLADGFGIYLVFWFGLTVGALPKAPAGITKPLSAIDLERSLTKMMSREQQERFDVVVLEVEPPK
ncbi:NACHT domain-containing protein [Sulfitobacter dubius]|uniref:NACHT domain-containing protein n=1 Tax=Sulfitobacter dubius TaxID=218673 RepID=UPI0022B03438|nr:hypothetical protein [Sulfitobacter dubius]MCZ4365495.1 hypothetical protein [Sulfitobacter dubius]